MPQRHFNRTLVVLALAAIATCASAVPSASARVYRFEPTSARNGVLTYAVTGVPAARVNSARVRTGRGKARRVSLPKAKRAARRGVLRLRLDRRASRRPSAQTSRRLTIVADTTPPETSIASGPAGTVSSQSASFAFASERRARFECQLDGGAWAACDSPKSFSALTEGSHVFAVRARDKAGNLDPTPATRTWTIDLPDPTPPTEPLPAPTPTEPVPTPTEPIPSEPAPAPPSGALMFDGFGSANGPNGLITNEYAGWHSSDGTAVHSPVWRSDGGSLFSVAATDRAGRTSQVAYTGKLDSSFADRYSQSYTHSNKMRFWTKASGFGDVRVDAAIKPTAWAADAPATWAGFKFYLRREVGATDSSFYTVEPIIKDGHVYIQKKCLGDTGGGNYSSGGTYYLLASKSGFTTALGSWREISATVKTNADGSVTIGLWRDGTLAAQAVDRGVRSDGTGCAPLAAGHVGFRSDSLQYYLDDFAVSALP
jgi:hypothetical protein